MRQQTDELPTGLNPRQALVEGEVLVFNTWPRGEEDEEEDGEEEDEEL